MHDAIMHDESMVSQMTNFVPSAFPVAIGGGESSSHKITPAFYDSDSADTHTFTVDTTNTLGSVTINDDGTFSYNPAGRFEYLALGEKTTDTFTYTVIDSSGGSSSATVTIELFGSNDGPVAFASSETTGEGSAVTITPSYSDVDASDTHIVSIINTNTAGAVITNADGTFSYDTDGKFDHLGAGETATDSFFYVVTDGSWASAGAQVTITITGENDAPIAAEVSGETNEDSSVIITPSYSDADASDTHSFSVDTTSTLGSVTVNDDGTFSYHPQGQFDGLTAGETATDSFTYTVTDSSGATSVETVRITISGLNDVPVVSELAAETSEEESVLIEPVFSDADTSDTHTVTVDASETTGQVTLVDGSLQYNPNGQFEYLSIGESKIDTFTYTVDDGHGGVVTKTVTVTINGTNDAPVTAEVSAETNEDSSVVITPSYSDADTSDTHSFSVDTTNTRGSVTVNDDGTFSYHPQGQFDGLTADETATDTFTYTVTDSSGATSTETVTIKISGVNDAPVVDDIAATTSEGESVFIEPTFSDAEVSDTHTVTVDASEATGQVTLVDGSFQYNPNGQFEHLVVGESATDTFTYTVNDGNGGVVTKTVTMTITGTNDAPVAAEVFSETNEDSSVVITPSYSDADTSDTHSFSVDTTNTLGSVTVNDDDTFSYDPTNLVGSLGLGESITDTFTYTVTDSAGESSAATAIVTVTGDSEGLTGSLGDDTYLIQASSGSTMIDYSTEVDDGGYDTVVFEDLSLLDLTITTVDHDGDNGTALKLSWDADEGMPAGQLQIANMGKHIERFEFADGTTLSKIEVLNDGRVELTGTDGDDKISAGDLAERINGGEGEDTVRYLLSSASVTVNLSDQSQNSGDAAGDEYISIENIIGTDTYGDTLTGDVGDNILWGYGGDDALYGGEGRDYLFGGAGADHLDGGTGSDIAYYHASDAGVTINLAEGTAIGGYATGDVLVNIESIEGSHYDDVLIGDSNNNALYAQNGLDRLYGGEGDDTLNAYGSGADYLDGGEGEDAVRYRWSHAAVTVNLSDQSQNAGDAAGDEYISIENVIGTDSYSDTLIGNAGDNKLWGLGGDDALFGGEGNDSLYGGAGADHLDGGNGSDLVDYSESDAGVTINLAEDTASGGYATGDILVSIETIGGSHHDDLLIGDSNHNSLYARSGIDRLYGGKGNDTLNAYGLGADYLDGGEGTDTVRYYWSKTAVTVNLADQSQNAGDAAGDEYISIENIMGTDAHGDVLTGDAGDNSIWAYGGDDQLNGGRGNDVLTGGSGSDTFVFSGDDFGNDVITDFVVGGGSDDVVRLDSDVFADFESVIEAASNEGTGTVIMLDENSSITLLGVLKEDLLIDDFQFV
ncbi:Bifunctional hemolysin/adenylate cyclase precursor [Pseudovibrio sp. W64]|nr:Bifunctional hemolysin/adenylate cyclase precursor [Pseudovibrio sp. W64]